MADLVMKIVDCVRVRDQKSGWFLPLSYALTLGPSSPPPRVKLIADAKESFARQGLAYPPFEGIIFVIRDP